VSCSISRDPFVDDPQALPSDAAELSTRLEHVSSVEHRGELLREAPEAE